MDRQRKAVRGYIAGMAPNRAVEFVRSFDLPEEEAQTQCREGLNLLVIC